MLSEADPQMAVQTQSMCACVDQDTSSRCLLLFAACHHPEATKRGLGAALLRKPTKLAKMVAGIAAQVDLPITVKIRTGKHYVVRGGLQICRCMLCAYQSSRVCQSSPTHLLHSQRT